MDGDEDEEGTHDEYLHEQGNTPIKNWRMREIFGSGNFYPSSSGTTYVLFSNFAHMNALLIKYTCTFFRFR